MIKKNPDMLSFGNDINEKECEYIISIDTANINNDIIVTKDSKYYKDIVSFKRIGKKYFASYSE